VNENVIALAVDRVAPGDLENRVAEILLQQFVQRKMRANTVQRRGHIERHMMCN
jgi:hypothetical protein